MSVNVSIPFCRRSLGDKPIEIENICKLSPPVTSVVQFDVAFGKNKNNSNLSIFSMSNRAVNGLGFDCTKIRSSDHCVFDNRTKHGTYCTSFGSTPSLGYLI